MIEEILENNEKIIEDLKGNIPNLAPWGQEIVNISPDLKRRIKKNQTLSNKVAIVLGAGGALGPEFINALLLQGNGAVIGTDIQLTYICKDAGYRYLDITNKEKVKYFFDDVRKWANKHEMELGTTYDLVTIQTSSKNGASRELLLGGKIGLIEALKNEKLFYMSTGEVYGAPSGAPYSEDHQKEPLSDYARFKLAEEKAILNCEDLFVTALRTWTIVMVNYNQDGKIISTRNYNDPLIILSQKLAHSGLKIPIIDETILGTFHLGEEVAQVGVTLGSMPIDSNTWGESYNCIGQPATHKELRDITYETFFNSNIKVPWWNFLAKAISNNGKINKKKIQELSSMLELFGQKKITERLPFLYTNTHLDSRKLQQDIGYLLNSYGGSSTEAVKRLSLGLKNDYGKDSIMNKRFKNY